jgi:hypothetical protein
MTLFDHSPLCATSSTWSVVCDALGHASLSLSLSLSGSEIIFLCLSEAPAAGLLCTVARSSSPRPSLSLKHRVSHTLSRDTFISRPLLLNLRNKLSGMANKPEFAGQG